MPGIGNWNSGTYYQANSVVIGSDGNLYKAVVTNGGQSPISNPTYWEVMSSETAVPTATLEAGNLPLSFLDAQYQPFDGIHPQPYGSAQLGLAINTALLI